VWTTLRLTLHADGRTEHDLVGASPFPRHWVYDADGELSLKAGVADWRGWLTQPSSTATPWGAEDAPVVVAHAESELERELSTLVMHGARKPKVRNLAAGTVLAEQGSPGDTLFLVLDGMLDVVRDGTQLGTLGPGAIVGERAIVQNAPRAATLVARTALRIAETAADTIDRQALAGLAEAHRQAFAR
jgi:hypothetical protein